MLAAIFLTIGSAIIGVLGFIHLLYTFTTDMFEPRDKKLGEQLRKISPVLTADTTMWNAWVGFNASHSLGAMLFAFVYGYLAMFQLEFLLASSFLVVLSLVTLASFLGLARAYWFRAPLAGISVSTALFVAGYLVAYL